MVLGYHAKNVPADICHSCRVERFYGHNRVLQCLGYILMPKSLNLSWRDAPLFGVEVKR